MPGNKYTVKTRYCILITHTMNLNMDVFKLENKLIFNYNKL